jgi:replicative DNA helicase
VGEPAEDEEDNLRFERGIMTIANSLIDRVPPHNLNAEEAVLGAIFLQDNLYDKVREMVKPQDFYHARLRWIFECMESLRDSGISIDLVSVKDALARSTVRVGGKDKSMLDEIGGGSYLIELGNSCAVSANWHEYCDIVHRDAVYRRLIEAGGRVTSIGYDNAPDVQMALSEAASTVMEVVLDNTTESKSASEIMRDFTKTLNSPDTKYFTAPHVPFVRFRPGDLGVVAAGPSVGKTATALHWADEWSRTKKVTYFEYEMTETDLMTRLVCTHAGVTWEQIQDRDLNLEEIERIEDAVAELGRRNLRIQEVWCPIGTLVAKVRQEAQRGTEIVILDHLGLIPFDIPNGMNLAKAIGTQVTGRLKRLASELQIVIILLVQLSREGQKDGMFPKLHHLRDSGEIEQDASIVFTLWSERSIDDNPAKKAMIRERSDILRPDELCDNSFTLIRVGVEKNRNGRLGEQYVLYHGATFRYEERDKDISPYPKPEPVLFN